jgi:hypothetical protein
MNVGTKVVFVGRICVLVVALLRLAGFKKAADRVLLWANDYIDEVVRKTKWTCTVREVEDSMRKRGYSEKQIQDMLDQMFSYHK